ncbi:outer membrane beta-barrel protein [Arenicella xantha]|uniref:Putative beta-barrel porin 2 n=1 Tax=Arenicella xantha TaxID=644221 RepID=A0A395JR65_9GAMM|nr:outer membrane beta-barrel protein [Arenicella xantha]RBP52946.1 putative beta-barrel porin 2 [Arenicella xantha]
MKTIPASRSTLIASAVMTSLLLTTDVTALESKPHKIGATEVDAQITSSLGYGNNVFRGSSDETSTGIFSIQPIVQAIRETNEQRIAFGYEGNGVVFFDSRDDNYLSSKLSGDYLRKLNDISEFGIGLSFEDGSTVRGTDITEGSNGSVKGATDFTRKDLSLSYGIGSYKVGPSLELSYNFTDLGFDNFELINQGRDYKLDNLSARLGYQYSVATKVFVDLGYSDYKYDSVTRRLGVSLDNTEQSFLIGVHWRLSRLTSGEVSVGKVDKEFDSFEDPESFTSWNAQLEWTPTPRDKVTLESFSRPFEQAGTGLFQDVDQVSIEWVRELSKKVSASGGLTIGSVDFGSVQRDDDYESFRFGILYRSGRYSEWALDFEREDKNSNLPQFDYGVNTLYLSYSLSL